jgi:hypothetical protein
LVLCFFVQLVFFSGEISLNILCSAFLPMVVWVVIHCPKRILNVLARTWMALVIMVVLVCLWNLDEISIAFPLLTGGGAGGMVYVKVPCSEAHGNFLEYQYVTHIGGVSVMTCVDRSTVLTALYGPGSGSGCGPCVDFGHSEYGEQNNVHARVGLQFSSPYL